MRSFGDAFSNAFLGAYQMFSAAEERKKQEEAAKMYFNMMAEDAQRNVQPFSEANTQAQFGANWANSNVEAANAPITTSPDRLADTRSTRFLTMTPQERLQAGLTQEQSDAMDKQLQGEGPINMQQANAGVAQTLTPVARQADNTAQQTQMMLAQAKERYGSEMFGKLGALVEKGMPPQMAMKIADSHIEKAAVAAEKQQLNAYFKVFSDPKATDQDRQAAAAGIASLKPQMAGMFKNMFGLKQDAGFTLGQGQTRYDSQGRPIASIAPKPENTVTWGPVQYDPQGRAYQVSNRNEIRPLTNYDKPPKDGGVGDLSPDEVKQKNIIETWIKNYEKKFVSPGGGFNPEKAEMNDPEGYKKYQDYINKHGELIDRSLKPKTKPATESKKLQVSFDERDKMRALLIQRMSPEQADAYIMQHYEVNPSDSRR